MMMEGLALLFTMCVSLFYGESDWWAFLLSALVSWTVGGSCLFFGRRAAQEHFSRADSFMVVALSWVVFSLIGMLPFILFMHMDVASAFFETMSGFTTMGATVITDIDAMTHATRFWRANTQWMGGLGIVVFSFALIPLYEMKNANVFSAEVTGIGLDRLRPKIGSTARRLLLIYLLLTSVCALFYWAGPMNLYDAVCHAMTTVATGGFSTHSESIGYFHSAYVEYVASVFMVISSINFSLFYYVSIRRGSVMLKNEELHAFLWIVFFLTGIFMLLFRYAPMTQEAVAGAPQGLEQTFRTSFFHVATVITTTGFAAETYDYVSWGAPFWMPTVFIMALGGCAGSTAGGIKVIRLLVSLKAAFNEFLLQLHPRAVVAVRISGHVLPVERVRRTLTFIFIYIFLAVLSIFLLTCMGLDVDTSIGASISSLSNVGPGTGLVGPSGTFAEVPALGKCLLSLLMVIGRLEIFTVLFLFFPSFWAEKK